MEHKKCLEPPTSYYIYIYTLWLFNIAMENGPFIDGLPNLKMVDLSMAMSNNQMVYIYIYTYHPHTVSWVGFWGLNTFSEAIWSARDIYIAIYTPIIIHPSIRLLQQLGALFLAPLLRQRHQLRQLRRLHGRVELRHVAHLPERWEKAGKFMDFTRTIWEKREEHREKTRKYGTNMEFTGKTQMKQL